MVRRLLGIGGVKTGHYSAINAVVTHGYHADPLLPFTPSSARPPWPRRAWAEGPPSSCLCVENKAAQTSASWLSGGPFQRKIVPQAAPSFGQPRPISRLGRAGRPYRPCFPHSFMPSTSFLFSMPTWSGLALRLGLGSTSFLFSMPTWLKLALRLGLGSTSFLFSMPTWLGLGLGLWLGPGTGSTSFSLDSPLEWAQAEQPSAALEAATSSTRGRGGAPSGSASSWKCRAA